MDRFQPRDVPHNEPTPLDQKLFVHMGGDAALRIGPPPGFGTMARPHNEPTPLDQKRFVHMGSDAALRIGPSPGFGSMASRSNDVPSSSHATQFPGHRVGNQGNSHDSFVPYRAGRSSSHVPAPSYPDVSEEFFAPASSHVDNRRVAMKRKNPVDGINVGDYYVGSSSSSRFCNIVQPNPTAHAEPLLPQMALSIGPSNWNDQHLVNQEGSQRNVRARHDRANISVEPRPGSNSTSSNNHLPLFHSAASAFVSTSAERNQAPFSQSTRTLPSGATGITGRMGRRHHFAMHSSSTSVAGAPTVHGSSDSAILANGGYAVPRAVHGDAVPSYAHPSSAASSSSRVVPSDAVIPSYPPATSTSIRINQPSPIGTAASSRQTRHVSMTHANSARNRMARSSFYGINPLMVEAQLMMMESQLALYQSARQAIVDPHRDLRLNIDEMSYEELLALEESIGNVNTGLADEKILGCVKEVVCCSSDQTEDDENEEDGRCLVCLEGYKDNDLLGTLKCRHDFHSSCIKKWLQVKNACPVCKQAAA